MSIANKVRNQCACIDQPGECPMCKVADEIDRLTDIAEKSEIFACQWRKVRPLLVGLPGITLRGDDLYNAIFPENKV